MPDDPLACILHIGLAVGVYLVTAVASLLVIRRAGGNLKEMGGRSRGIVAAVGTVANLFVLATTLSLFALLDGRELSGLGLAFGTAGLVAVLAERLGGHLIDPRIAYLACPAEPEPTPFGTAFEVLDRVPFARKAMRAWLRQRGYGDVVVKKRGVNVVPEQVRASLRLDGSGPTATLVLTRTDDGPLALLVRRA